MLEPTATPLGGVSIVLLVEGDEGMVVGRVNVEAGLELCHLMREGGGMVTYAAVLAIWPKRPGL